MFPELIPELEPTARVLILKLNAGRPQGIAVGCLLHPLLLELLGSRLCFFGKLRSFIRCSTIPASCDNKRASAVGIGKAEMQRRKATHRQADDMRLVDFKCIKYRSDIVPRSLLRITFTILRNFRRWIAASVIDNATVALSKMTHLQF